MDILRQRAVWTMGGMKKKKGKKKKGEKKNDNAEMEIVAVELLERMLVV